MFVLILLLISHRSIDGDPFKIKVIVDVTTDKRLPVSRLNEIFERAIDANQRIGDYPVTRDQYYQVAELPGMYSYFFFFLII